MTDDTIFFVCRDLDAEAVRDVLARLSNVDPDVIILAPALGYEWEEDAEVYRRKTVLQWHAFSTGDGRLQFEIVCGGALLDAPTAPETFTQMACALGASILALDAVKTVQYTPDGDAFEVKLREPEEYGEDGPVILGRA